MRIFPCLAILALLLGPTAFAAAAAAPAPAADAAAPTAIGGGGGLVVGGIAVDVEGKNADEARANGWREAERLAWPLLWNRMSGEPAAAAPKLNDAAVDSMVSAIEIEQEQIGRGGGPTRYIARLAVVFDRARAASRLGKYAQYMTSPPLLVLPVLQDAAVRQAHEVQSPWLKAWARLRAGETPIDYVRIQPAPADILLLNAWQAERRHLSMWRDIVDRYQVADVVIPELILDRRWAGGPVSGLLIVRYGTAGHELGRVRLVNRGGDVDALMDEGVRQADRLYRAALREGRLVGDPALIGDEAELMTVAGPEIGAVPQVAEQFRLTLKVQTEAGQAAGSVEARLRSIPGVVSVRTVSFAPGGDSVVEVGAGVDLETLRHALDAAGWRIEGDRLRPRRPDEAPLPPPVPREDAVVESEGAAPPATPR
jgi:hypothetical protein